ncbi:MAG: hypothetical protein K1Y02_13675 [Candidatus Hydrogenedentes bacterium]|nr:hypothetical protein [Candidatus Hydrogenedentota bacterium]
MTTTVYTQHEAPGKRSALAGALIWDLIRLQWENHPVVSVITLILGFLLPFDMHWNLSPSLTMCMVSSLVVMATRGIEVLDVSGTVRFLATWPVSHRKLSMVLWLQATLGPLILLGSTGIPALLIIALLGGPLRAYCLLALCMVLFLQQWLVFETVMRLSLGNRGRQGILPMLLPAAPVFLLLVLMILSEEDYVSRSSLAVMSLMVIGAPILAFFTIRLLANHPACPLDKKTTPISVAYAATRVMDLVAHRKRLAIWSLHIRTAISAVSFMILIWSAVWIYGRYLDVEIEGVFGTAASARLVSVGAGVIAPMLFTKSTLLRTFRSLPKSGTAITLYFMSIAASSAAATWVAGLFLFLNVPGVTVYALTGWMILSAGAASLGIPLLMRFSVPGFVLVTVLLIHFLDYSEDWSTSPAVVRFYCFAGIVLFTAGIALMCALVTRSSRVYRTRSIEEIRDIMIWGDNEGK